MDPSGTNKENFQPIRIHLVHAATHLDQNVLIYLPGPMLTYINFLNQIGATYLFWTVWTYMDQTVYTESTIKQYTRLFMDISYFHKLSLMHMLYKNLK